MLRVSGQLSECWRWKQLCAARSGTSRLLDESPEVVEAELGGRGGRLLAGGAITTRGALEQITVMGVRRHPRASNAPEPANDSCIFINRPVFIRHFFSLFCSIL